MVFCTECGKPLHQSCPSCGFENTPQAKFCGKCGTALGAAGQRPAAKRRSRQGSPRVRKTPRRVPSPAVQSRPTPPEAERRQLTVMFCDLVGSTALSEQLDPEDLREVVRIYQETSTEVIRRYHGHIAQHLGDGLLVYFGYPVAHEDEAARAVRAGIEIIAALHESPLQHQQLPTPLQVRIGIHTGLVVIGEIGSSEKREILALGETPNIAARVQGVAEPDTVAISAVTQRLVHGLFECQDLGPQPLKGISSLVSVYRVLGESTAQSRFEVAVGAGLSPLGGREEELALLLQRWAQAKEGAGQVVLLSGEAGIGKSRLVQTLKEHVGAEGATRIEFRCSPYHQNSALYPIIARLQRLLQFAREDSPATKLEKLQRALSRYRFPQVDTLPLLAILLSLPHPDGYPPITVSPQKQKEKTQAAFVAWVVEEAAQNTVYTAWEDMHWADPSTLEVLTLLLDQVSTTRLLAVLTFRPEFIPPWGNRSHVSQVTLSRLGRSHVEVMVKQVTGSKVLPAEVVQQIVAKTDGVPLFVEELTKTVMESGLVRDEGDRYVGAHGDAAIPPLAIPSTLQDSLMARLDRLAPVKEIAQLGATLGREFSYELLHAVSSFDEGSLQQGLRQLVEVELLYQRGLPPHATYLFKHALIQDTAYQSLLKSRRQRYHQQIAQVLEAQFPDTTETQPELLAHHYTEAGLIAQALPYWQQAGQRAVKRSAGVEAISHLTKGLRLLQILPDTPERPQYELDLQMMIALAWMTTKSYAAPEVGQAYNRALELCRQIGETPQLFPVLSGLVRFYYTRAELQTARELGEQCLRLAQGAQDPTLLMEAHRLLGATLLDLGEFGSARPHLEQGIALYDPQQHRSLASFYGTDPGVVCHCYISNLLWCCGYPDQALQRSQESLTLAEKVAHPVTRAGTWHFAAVVHQFRREGPAAHERAEAAVLLCAEYGFAIFAALGTIDQGWALAEQGQGETGIRQIRQGLTAYRTVGAEVLRTYLLALLAEVHRKEGQLEEGLAVLAEAQEIANRTGERYWEAELYRLKGEVTLQSHNQHPEAGAEACFLKAIDIAQKQHAKSLELRAATSLARLWQQQGKQKEAHQLLSPVYNWFTEGFDTKDLQEAKALLDELSSGRQHEHARSE
jgi:TOMM system kinase/cyclase fusion protein